MAWEWMTEEAGRVAGGWQSGWWLAERVARRVAGGSQSGGWLAEWILVEWQAE